MSIHTFAKLITIGCASALVAGCELGTGVAVDGAVVDGGARSADGAVPGDSGRVVDGGADASADDPGAYLPFLEPPSPHSGWTPVAQDPNTPGIEGTTCAPVADGHGLAQTLLCVPQGMDSPDPGNPSPLVVVLPGYTMSIEDYRQPAQWDGVGAAHGFYVLYAQVENGIAFPGMGIPEGPRAWYFYDGKRAKAQADAANLAALVQSLLASDAYSIHPDHVYITGISAGAYMAVAMMADYPEIFAAGAIVSGGPYGCTAACANNPLTVDTYGTRDAPVPFFNDNAPPWDDPARVINADPARWNDPDQAKPRIIAYHGEQDGANVMANTDDLASQWRQVLGLDSTPDNALLGIPDYFIVPPSTDSPGHQLELHVDSSGAIAVATIKPFDLGHGIMVDPGTGPQQGGFDEFPSKTACDPTTDSSCENDWTNTADFYEAYTSARFFGIVRE